MTTKDIEEIETLLSNLSFWNVLDTDEQCELRTTLTQHHEAEVKRAVKIATIEAWNDAIELSEKLEESNTKFDEWRAFKCFRNALRDKISELVAPTTPDKQ